MPDRLIRMVCRTTGSALIELLAALAVTAGGIAGIVQMQLFNTTVERDLLSRLQAVLLVDDVARKIDVIGTASGAFNTNLNTPPSSTVNCRRVPCSASQLKQFYISHWKCRLGRWNDTGVCRDQLAVSGKLLQGDGQLSSRNNGIVISVRWNTSDGNRQTLTRFHTSL